jgi:hypothetical protein
VVGNEKSSKLPLTDAEIVSIANKIQWACYPNVVRLFWPQIGITWAQSELTGPGTDKGKNVEGMFAAADRIMCQLIIGSGGDGKADEYGVRYFPDKQKQVADFLRTKTNFKQDLIRTFLAEPMIAPNRRMNCRTAMRSPLAGCIWVTRTFSNPLTLLRAAGIMGGKTKGIK